MSTQSQHKIKVIFLGSAGVGKTSIIQHFMYSSFNGDYESTIGIDFFMKSVPVNGTTVNLQIWDTAGQEQFKSLTPGYIREAQVVVLVYDTSDPKTLEVTKDWYNLVLEVLGAPPILFLVGNKIDLGKNVNPQDVKAVANDKMTTLETSAKTGDGITALFKAIAEAVSSEITPPTTSQHVEVTATPVPAQKKEGCC